MRRLQRPQPGPTCLKDYQHGRDNWGDVSPDCKAEIRDELHEMQSGRCAYCECPLGILTSAGHIEHFIQKGRMPKVTFDWENLYYSCLTAKTCGKYKDTKARGTYRDVDLIRPDVDDPADYFDYTASGEIKCSADVGLPEQRRANETIRVFNLNDDTSGLRTRRATAFKCIEKELSEIQDFVLDPDISDGDMSEDIQNLLIRIEQNEFGTSTTWLARDALVV